jgi:tRNA(fMet)-specific endonuclease VapC
MICLDTNVVIAVISGRATPIRERMERALLSEEPIALPAIVLFELWFGIFKSQRRASNIEGLEAFLARGFEILPLDRHDAVEAGDIRAMLERLGTPIGPYDMLIAAQARRRDAVLVTANSREFARVPGLKIEDWTVPFDG